MLDPPHLLVLAHVLRRPIICYAHAAVGEVRDADAGRTFSSYAAKGERMSGIYLPVLHPPHVTSREPVTIAYTPGHFSVLVSSETAAAPQVWRALGLEAPSPAAVPVPLVDETMAPLPVLFPPPVESADPTAPQPPTYRSQYERDLLEAYLTVHTATLVAPASADDAAADDADALEVKTLPIAAQRLPSRAAGKSAGPADEFFEAVWERRAAAANEEETQDDVSGLVPPPAASRTPSLHRDESDQQLAEAIAASLRDTGAGNGGSASDSPVVIQGHYIDSHGLDDTIGVGLPTVHRGVSQASHMSQRSDMSIDSVEPADKAPRI